MAIFDYNTEAELSPTGSEAELFPTRGRRTRQPLGFGRFARAADAIRFAIEELPPERLLAAQLKVGEKRFGGDGIRRLYESAEYPLARRADDAVPYNNRGNARRKKGDLDGAIKDYAEAIRLKPNFALAYYNRGLARRKKGDLANAKAAVADFQKYLDLGGGMRDGDQGKKAHISRSAQDHIG